MFKALPVPGRAFARALGVAALALAALHAQARPFAWVGHGGSVSVIDAATDTVAATVPLGATANALAVASDGSRAYAAQSSSLRISVIDGATRSVVAQWPLAAAPGALAVSPDGRRLFVLVAGGLLQVMDTATGATLGSVVVGGGSGLAVSPDGSRVYVAAGTLQVVDTATLTLVGSVSLGADAGAMRVALSPDGTQAWVAHTIGLFSGGVSLVDTGTLQVAAALPLGAMPGQLALTPDGSRVYVGVDATWVDTGYGAGFFPGRVVVVIDAIARRYAASIDLGADGSNWTQQNTAGGIAVTADRGSVYIAVPRLSSVAAADVNATTLRTRVAVAGAPGPAAAARTGEALLPYRVDAADDTASATTLGGTALASVLANDRLGGLVPTPAHVTIVPSASPNPGVVLDAASGAVTVAAGTAVGSYMLGYRICEKASPANCDDASVTVGVTVPRGIVAADDAGSGYAGVSSVLNVLANDTLAGAAATTTSTRLTLLSATAGLTLATGSGAVGVAAGTPPGAGTLRYRLCEAAVPANCDDALVQVNVLARPIVATADSGSAPRTGGRAIASVLANDTLAGAAATLSNVTLTALSTTQPGLTLGADAAVQVAAGTAPGTHTLRYRICESTSPANCAEADARVTVAPYLVDAVDDTARASSKRAGTALASVLANDRFAGGAASIAQVTLQQVSVTPANAKIRLDPADGSVDILGRTQSGTYRLVYRLCEKADPTNCDEATVTLDLSGGA